MVEVFVFWERNLERRWRWWGNEMGRNFSLFVFGDGGVGEMFIMRIYCFIKIEMNFETITYYVILRLFFVR